MGMMGIGRTFIELDSVDSTNKHAAELLAGGKIGHGAVIMAHAQTAGRGQRGRTWFSSSGLDLTASVVLVPQGMKLSAQFDLAKLVAVAVHDVVSGSFVDAGRDPAPVRIKWPNDVLVDRRKIAGILIKNEVVGTLVQSCVVGIGLNVNSTDLDIDINATSLLLETGREEKVREVLERICERLDVRWTEFLQGGRSIAEVYSGLLWARGRFSEFTLDGAPFTGRPLDVDDDGRLIVEDHMGAVNAYGLERLRFAAR
jgi:BirA family transcriptional regulator, biotin operon repressor / biotin---[acetyl-CoA-carboxylase] ligase